jgi:hypothetical protein
MSSLVVYTDSNLEQHICDAVGRTSFACRARHGSVRAETAVKCTMARLYNEARIRNQQIALSTAVGYPPSPEEFAEPAIIMHIRAVWLVRFCNRKR